MVIAYSSIAGTRQISDFADTDLGLVYYNYRHYNPLDGRWTSRDVKRDRDANLYNFLQQTPFDTDVLGMESNVLSKCERFVAKYKEEMKNTKLFTECKISIRCKYKCDADHYADALGTDIVIYVPKSYEAGEPGLRNTINHELVHVYDTCRGFQLISCENLWYGEMRGSYYGQCAQIKNETERRTCAYRGALRSIRHELKQVNAPAFKNCLENPQAKAEEAFKKMKTDPYSNPFTTPSK